MMEYTIKTKYLIFPVNNLVNKKNLMFKSNGETIYTLEIRIDNISPVFYAYIDVSRFKGQTLSINTEPEMELYFKESDEMNIEKLYHEPLRPQIHFTTKNGWINDPNGLVYLDGVYHMFYQHNPAETEWGNMHWGHAISTDLIHWEQKDIALFPDERGAMFSGSAILDENNLLGMNKENNKTALLYYTTTSPFCQHLSYSTDNFETIKRYGEKAVVPHMKAANRDPKVVFCEELNSYIMALYLDEDVYCLLKSSNLTSWEEIQKIHLSGDNECPDIFMLRDIYGARKWVIIGAHDKYLVGRFENGEFIAEQSVQSLHYGTSGYAGQSFSGLPDNRVVRMVWDRWSLPSPTINGQMGFPMEMSLSSFNGRCYLEANPIKEIEKLYNSREIYNDVTISADNSFNISLEQKPYLLKFKGKNYKSGKLYMTIFGVNIEFDFDINEIKYGDCIAPISITNNGFDITVILDRCSVEMFADGGKIFISGCDKSTYNDYNLPYLSINSKENVTLDLIELHSLNSIWSN